MEKVPVFTQEELQEAIVAQPNLPQEIVELVNKINDNYEYWDKVKYKKLSVGYTATDLWKAVKIERLKNDTPIWEKYGIHFSKTNRMAEFCHDFDWKMAAKHVPNQIPDTQREVFILNSLMDESIRTCQMEGASTTVEVAKDMLSKQRKPRTNSERMIANTYEAIQFIKENQTKDLTAELILHLHYLITKDTLARPEAEGQFRQNDDVVVEDTITNTVVHRPPTYTEIPAFVTDFCTFFNSTTNSLFTFIHPLLKGIIIHYLIAFMHPFVDGNGRTARALFYWYMLRRGYDILEYLSISNIIYRSKPTYEKTFVYAQQDGYDIGYFITYNIKVLEAAYQDLLDRVNAEQQLRNEATVFLQMGNINERQAAIIKIYYDNPRAMLTVRDIQTRFNITPTTAKTDLMGLVNLGLLDEIALNKVKKGYMRSEEFEERINIK